MKKTIFTVGAAWAALLSASVVFSQDNILTVTSPSPWTTLRTDSVEVSLQADVVQLPQKTVALKVSRNAGGRSSALFSKTVNLEEGSADVFLGRSKDVPLGGADYLSLEWSIPGSDIKGVIEPIGVVKLDAPGKVPSLSAQKLKDGVSESQAADILTGAPPEGAAGVKLAAGWNTEALFILIKADANISEVQIALDGKCGKSAFLSWADRFVIYSAEKDSVYGIHYKRETGKNKLEFEEMPWGDSNSLSVTKAEISRLIKIKWYDIGLQPFEERNIGISAYATNKSKRTQPVYPPTAKRDIPGTWGDVKLDR